MAKAHTERSPEIVVIFNPQAGSAHRAELQRLVSKHFAGRHVELCESDKAEDVPDLLAPWVEKGVHLVVAAGGDGTVSAVASALVNSDVPLGILPLGTGNVLARELEVPLKADQAARLLAGRFAVRRLDAIRVGERAYLLSVSVGLSAMTMRRTEREDKKRFGRWAYLWTFLLNLFGLPPYSYEAVVDGQSFQVRANELHVVNAGIVGYKALRWGPNVEPDDGRLDLCFVRARSALDYLRVLWQLLTRTRHQGTRFNCVQVYERIEIRSPAGLPVQGDGDVIGHTPVEITLLTSALKVAVPAKEH